MPISNVLLPTRAILEIQNGGPGSSNYVALGLINDISNVRLGAIDSTEADITRIPGRNEKTGLLQTIASWKSGAVVSYSSELEITDVKIRRLLESLQGRNNLRIRYFNGERADVTNYDWIRILSGVQLTKPSGGFTRDMVNSFDGVEAPADPQRRTFPVQADAFLEREVIARSSIGTASITALAIRDICSIGYMRSAGDVAGENTNNPGNKEFVAIGAKTGAGQTSKVFYTADKGATWTSTTTFNDFDGQGICRAGANIVICANDATGGGLAWATVAAVRSGTVTWTRSTNVSAGARVQAVRAVNDNVVIAVGNTGAWWLSTDSGKSFTAQTAIGANNLTSIAVAGDDLQWFGGASNTLIRRYKDVPSTISGITGTLNDLAVPPGMNRGQELYIALSDGSVRRTINGTATTPTFTNIRQDSAVSSVSALAFGGPNGEFLYIVESTASPTSRIAVDHSGGYGGGDVEVLGSFTSPTNAGITRICAADHYTVMAVGPASGGAGYLELIA